MHISSRILLVFLFMTHLSGCNQLFYDAELKAVKMSLKFLLKKECGKDEPCLAAIEKQSDGCHEKHKDEWEAYLGASYFKREEFMEEYTELIILCFVDENGDQYFSYEEPA